MSQRNLFVPLLLLGTLTLGAMTSEGTNVQICHREPPNEPEKFETITVKETEREQQGTD